MAVDNQQNGAFIFVYLFSGKAVPFFASPCPIKKGHRLKTAQNGEIVGFKSCRLLTKPHLHLSFDYLIFDPLKAQKHLMPCGFIHMASKVFGLVGWAGRIRTCGMRESKTRALPLGYGPIKTKRRTRPKEPVLYHLILSFSIWGG